VHPRRNVLQRSMGVSDDVEIDVRGPFQLCEGDTFILCSDGLHGLVKEQELKQIAQSTIEDAADEFLRRALERGAPDNVTVIVARVELANGDADFDETLNDTQKLIIVNDEALRDTDKIRVADPEPAAAPANIQRPSDPTAGRSRTSVLWALLFVTAIVAAGAWYYLFR
ncbi:MAG TPA: hypothetical protein VE010_03265, partial [Thermoanaerobaculia bacterium]|nr:hypothetical protein [Thermoanaerobaculia bacterium]